LVFFFGTKNIVGDGVTTVEGAILFLLVPELGGGIFVGQGGRFSPLPIRRFGGCTAGTTFGENGIDIIVNGHLPSTFDNSYLVSRITVRVGVSNHENRSLTERLT
jgi:hypothetical protein